MVNYVELRNDKQLFTSNVIALPLEFIKNYDRIDYIGTIICYTLTKIKKEDKMRLQKMLKSQLNTEKRRVTNKLSASCYGSYTRH